MNHWIEVTGKTEEEAIAAALAQLGLGRDEVSVELLERAKSGFLGIGGSPAKIRVAYTVEQSRKEKVEAFLNGLLERLQSDAVANVEETPEGNYKVVLEGSHLGALIGRRGETLDAIQQITNYAVNRGEETRVKIHIDAEHYRQKREESLQRLAAKVADKVVKYRKNVMLEPMNAYERHVIHTALQDWDSITTYSTGSEPNRRIVVALGKDGARTERTGRTDR
ncbi:MAG: RNA-binding cell elongation regulator Jag/EloR [Oscillospiraceae bacterium]|jgi:spoIIIJ-associated protein